MITTLETERLLLRGFREADLDPFAEFYASEASRFVGGPCSRFEAWRRMAAHNGHWVLRGYGAWALEERATGAFAGLCGPFCPEGWPEPEILWSLVASHRGRGFATEAALRARRHAYEVLGWRTAVSFIAADNAPSMGVARRLGCAPDGEVELLGRRLTVWRHPPP